MKKYSIEITSPYDKENLVAEIWDKDTMIAELSQEAKEIILTIYTKTPNIALEYEEFLSTIQKAKLDLFG